MTSLTATIKLQTKVVRTINVPCAELSEKLDLILAAVQSNNQSPSLNSQLYAPALPTTTQPANNNTDLPMPVTNPSQMAIPPRPHGDTDPYHKLAPILKVKPYKKTIPAKPPFTCGRCHKATTRTKDCMRPP